LTRGGRTISSQLIQRRDEIRCKLQSLDPEAVARRSNARLEGNAFHLQLLKTEYLITLPDYEIQALSDHSRDYLEVLILDYLLQAEEVESNQWISFREIPHGEFYSQNFKKTTEAKLTQKFQGRMEMFEQAGADFGAEPISLGDAGFSFQVLPRFAIALVFWDGGEEFRDKVNLLFEQSAGNCLPTEGLAILGRELCSEFIRTAEEEE